MKVLILNPPVLNTKFSRDGRCQSEANTWLDTFPPTTLASIAGLVREKYDTHLIDSIGSNLSLDQCIQQVQDYTPTFTVINTSTPTINMDLETAKIIKETTDSEIIMYGEHITARYHSLISQFPQLDYAILGEPETPIMNILDDKVESKGIATKKWDGDISQEKNLDDLPFPAYDLLPDYYFPLTGEKWMFVRSGRGCPYNCIYCVMPLISGRNPRYHSPEYMIKQFKWLNNDLDIHLWMLWDELATLDKDRMERMCDMIVEEGLNKKCRWFCTTRVDKFSYDLAKVMKNAGCKMISFGLESGDQNVLDLNNKGITIEQSKKAIEAAKKNNIRTIGHFILGLPGSNDESEKRTIEFAKDLKLDFAQFYVATPFPGSQFYKLAHENNWIIQDNWNDTEQGSAVVSYPNFPAERILYWRHTAYKDFYFRPHTIKSGLSMMSWQQLPKLPFYVLSFLDWMRK